MREKSVKIFEAPNIEGEDAARTKIQVLEDLSQILSLALKDIRSLEFVESTQLPEIKPGLDFYREVRRFEIALIQRALRHAGGKQALAASLLRINTTTLNSKIKAYNIDWRNGAS